MSDTEKSPATLLDELTSLDPQARRELGTTLRCGEIMYYLGACHHAYGCDDHPGCEKYQEAKYRASGMWPVNWSRERVQRASGKTPEGGT
jgi:hypothetical protein